MEIHTCQVLRSEIREKRAVASFQLFLGGVKFFLETGKFEGGSRRSFNNSRGGEVGEVLTIRGGGG